MMTAGVMTSAGRVVTTASEGMVSAAEGVMSAAKAVRGFVVRRLIVRGFVGFVSEAGVVAAAEHVEASAGVG